jgi:molybdate transport repressor ModE-like protein
MPLPMRVADLTGFDLLLSIARYGSIGLAARAHGISQPAASTRIRQLEALVGVPLVDRSPRGSRLTEAGALVADWARAAVDAAADLEAGVAALRAERDMHLRVAASLTVAEYLLPKWLAALRTVDPGTAVALSSGNSAEVAAQVLGGVADLGFIEGPDLPDGLHSRTVGHDELRLSSCRIIRGRGANGRHCRPHSRRRRSSAGSRAREPGERSSWRCGRSLWLRRCSSFRRPQRSRRR